MISSAPPAETSERPKIVQPDYLLLGATVALLAIGALMVYSASFVVAHNEFNDALYFLTRHLTSIAVGAVPLVVAMRVDYRRWRGLSLIAMLACVGLLVLVLAPGIGSRSYGAVRWIKLGPFFQLQPSELAKVVIALYLANWLARRGSRLRDFRNGSLPFIIIVVIVGGLVEVQPDLGTTFVIVGTAACVFFVAGANLLHIGAIGSAGILAGIALVGRMSGYRQDRIAAFLDPWSDLQGTGWHTAQTLIALGSGGPFGMGLGHSFQKFYWVPNAHTDAIYAIIGEELGFVGAVAVLGLFAVIAWRGFLIAWRAPDSFGRLLATGLTSTLILQALVNIAVVTNSIPYTGVTLPLVSYGGTSTVVSMLAVGLLLGISRHRGPYREEVEEDVPVQLAPPNAATPRRRDTRTSNRGTLAPVLSSRPHSPRGLSIASRAAIPGLQARPARRRTPTHPPVKARRGRWDVNG
jgi:cell division protein FtsW